MLHSNFKLKLIQPRKRCHTFFCFQCQITIDGIEQQPLMSMTPAITHIGYNGNRKVEVISNERFLLFFDWIFSK